MEDKKEDNVESLEEEVLDTSSDPVTENKPLDAEPVGADTSNNQDKTMSNTMTADWRNLSKSSNLKPKHRGLKIFIIVLIILAILAGGLFAYIKFLKPDSAKVYDDLVKSYSSSISKTLKANTNDGKSYAQDGSFMINTNIEEYKLYDGIALNYSLGVDTDSKLTNINLEYLENDKKILDANLYIKDEKLYLKSDQIYDKLLFIQDVSSEDSSDANIFDNSFSLEEVQDIQYLFDQGSLYLRKALKKATYKTEYDKLTINNKKHIVQKNTMIINKSNINDIKNSFVNSIKGDEKFLAVLKKEYKVEDKELMDSLDALLKEDSSQDFEEINVETCTMIITNKVLSFNLVEGNETLVNLIASSKKTYDVQLGDELKGKLTVNNKNDLTFETKYEGYTIEVELITTKARDSFHIIAKMTDQKGKSVSVSYKNSKSSKKVEKISVENAVDVSKMSQSEAAKIGENSTKVFSSSELLKTFMSDLETN